MNDNETFKKIVGEYNVKLRLTIGVGIWFLGPFGIATSLTVGVTENIIN